MAKYYGEIGFAKMVETEPGVHEEKLIKRKYRGDIIRNTRRYENSQYLNDNLNISNQFSIVADPYAMENFYMMRYLVWAGEKWKITNITVQYPRLVLEVGGVYNDGQ